MLRRSVHGDSYGVKELDMLREAGIHTGYRGLSQNFYTVFHNTSSPHMYRGESDLDEARISTRRGSSGRIDDRGENATSAVTLRAPLGRY